MSFLGLAMRVWKPALGLLVALSVARPALGQDGAEGLLALSAAEVDELETDARYGFPAVAAGELGRLGVTDLQTSGGMVSGMYRGWFPQAICRANRMD